MLINEVCKRCKLTKKAIEYYEEQGLICPKIMENGYRVFSEDDVAYLSKVAILRGLGLSVSDIKSVLTEDNFSIMQNIYDKKDLELADIQAKQQLLCKLMEKQDWEYVRGQLEQLEKKQSILTRLLDRFPGYYGKLISLHFAPYLNEPISTKEQQDAFETIIEFLDGVNITIPEDLQEYLDEATKNMDVAIVKKATENITAAIQDPEQYLKDNKEMLEQYEAIKASDEYKSTPAYRLKELLAQLNRENGYNDIFIPAMQRLSSSYRKYYENLIKANEIFLEKLKKVNRN